MNYDDNTYFIDAYPAYNSKPSPPMSKYGNILASIVLLPELPLNVYKIAPIKTYPPITLIKTTTIINTNKYCKKSSILVSLLYFDFKNNV